MTVYRKATSSPTQNSNNPKVIAQTIMIVQEHKAKLSLDIPLDDALSRRVGVQSSSDVLLGNIANISSTGTKNASGGDKEHTTTKAQRNKLQRLSLLDTARDILRDFNVTTSRTNNPHRTRHCLAVRFDKSEDIGITLNDDPHNSEAGLQNLVTCGSICSCAVCAHRRMMEYANDIKKTLIFAQNCGLVPIMVTLTAQHHKNAKLEQFVKNFKASWRYFASGRKWREFKDIYAIEHSITAREVTRSRKDDNGWHYHMHILLFLDAKKLILDDDLPHIEEQFRQRWISALHRNNLHGIPEIACKVTSGEHVGQQYLTKLGLTHDAKGNLEYELTGSANKGASIWDILHSASLGDAEAIQWYLEYVQVMTGENWITFSHGLRKLIENIELDEDTPGENDSLSLWYWITQKDWTVIVRNRSIGKLLSIVAKYRCYDKVQEFIRMLKNDR